MNAATPSLIPDILKGIKDSPVPTATAGPRCLCCGAWEGVAVYTLADGRRFASCPNCEYTRDLCREQIATAVAVEPPRTAVGRARALKGRKP